MIHKVWDLDNTVYRKCIMALSSKSLANLFCFYQANNVITDYDTGHETVVYKKNSGRLHSRAFLAGKRLHWSYGKWYILCRVITRKKTHIHLQIQKIIPCFLYPFFLARWHPIKVLFRPPLSLYFYCSFTFDDIYLLATLVLIFLRL